MRLDKYIASVTDYSRSDVKKILKLGLVEVAGVVVSDPATTVPESAAVTLDGHVLRAAGYRYFMLHKPLGYVCANKDKRHMTIMELLEEDNALQLHAAGRLDIDATGLVLISDDGQWIHRIISPKKQCIKTYHVETANPVDSGYISRFAEGISLEGERRKTLPADLEILDEQSTRLNICEGKYHQVKRMFAAMGNKVDSLHREKIGGISLDPDLLPGEYRPLTEAERDSV